MREATRRLRIAFALAERAEEKLDANGLASARREVGRFLLSASPKGPGAETGNVWFGSRVPDISARGLGELCVTVRQILDAVVRGASLGSPPFPRLRLVVGPVSVGHEVVVSVVEGSATDRFVLALMLLLAHVGSERVLACPRCGEAFLKLGRRTHCERTECRRRRNSEYWHRYKQTPAGKRALLKHRQRMYAKHGWTLGARSKKPRQKVSAATRTEKSRSV